MSDKNQDHRPLGARLLKWGGWAGFTYTYGVELARLESWEQLGVLIAAEIEDARALFELVGRVVAALALPLDLFVEVLFWLVPLQVPPEMRVPILAGIMLAGLLARRIAAGPARIAAHFRDRLFAKPRAALVFPLAEAQNGAALAHIEALYAKGPARLLMLGPMRDYLRGLKLGLPRPLLLQRFNRASEDLERAFASPLFGGDPGGQHAEARRRRLLAASLLFGVILLDMGLHDGWPDVALALLRIVQVALLVAATCITGALLLFAVSAFLAAWRSRGRRSRADTALQDAPDKAPGPILMWLVCWLLGKIEEGRDPALYDPGPLDLTYRPDSAPSPVLVARFEKDMSLGSLAGARLRFWKQRLEFISLGGRVYPVAAPIERHWRDTRHVVMVLCRDGEAVETFTLPAISWRQGAAAAMVRTMARANSPSPVPAAGHSGPAP